MARVLSDIDVSRSAPVACFLELEAAARSCNASPCWSQKLFMFFFCFKVIYFFVIACVSSFYIEAHLSVLTFQHSESQARMTILWLLALQHGHQTSLVVLLVKHLNLDRICMLRITTLNLMSKIQSLKTILRILNKQLQMRPSLKIMTLPSPKSLVMGMWFVFHISLSNFSLK